MLLLAPASGLLALACGFGVYEVLVVLPVCSSESHLDGRVLSDDQFLGRLVLCFCLGHDVGGLLRN